MSPVPLIPDNAPFSPEQRAWLNGFLAGVFSRAPGISSPRSETSDSAALQPLTILFGSQTGTAEGLARKAAQAAGRRGFAATVLDLAQIDAAQLAAGRNVLVITSTYGDGEPPDNAKALHAALGSQVANLKPGTGSAFPGLRFSVCALGDTNYTLFCQCGKDFDDRLEKLGATRVAPRVDCDLDYEEKFTAWLDDALTAFAPSGKEQATGSRLPSGDSEIINPPAAPETYSRKNPFPAPVLAVRNLSAAGSAKEVNHVELSLEGSGLAYAAGDALGVFPQNCPQLVGDILGLLGCDGEEAVPAPEGGSTSLRRALTELYDLGKPTAELLGLVGGGSLPDPAPGAGPKAAPTLAATLHHVLDAILSCPLDLRPRILKPAEFVRVLRKLQPRLYSISSSPRAHPGQVHLTVGAVRYEKDGRPRKGVCSTFLADRAFAHGHTRVFVHANPAFRPPADGGTPMIMVGPGTGIAPFRAFLEERQATGATGRNWLFFGDQRAATDFLYRDELMAMKAAGRLTRLDLAFSRDQAEKIYVQQRMLEHAAELHAWLEQGAHFYVCGDAARMAKDVDAALHQVIGTAGGKSPEAAAAYVQALKAAKRYQRDVY